LYRGQLLGGFRIDGARAQWFGGAASGQEGGGEKGGSSGSGHAIRTILLLIGSDQLAVNRGEIATMRPQS
ncbi:hypothetical protein AB4156_45070, partial [Cupriavidus sp. 2MCAB6]|uniref:hypothetical protein n=1 Tax=Cupriavidus sp. 2MCAB6 TaxID=3232981 RepID=UPI003F91077E